MSRLPVAAFIFYQNDSCVRISLRLLHVQPYYAELTIVIGNRFNEAMWFAVIADADVWFFLNPPKNKSWTTGAAL